MYIYIIKCICRCINNASNIKLNLTSNIFKNNKAANGGGIYLGDNKNSLEENRNVIFIKNNTFLNNYANNFGGAVYFKLLNNYNTTIIDNNVISNAADISGGGMYSVNNQFKNDFILKNNNNFLNNTVNSYKSDYTSKPYSIGLNENYINQRNFNIITGDYLSIGFNLYDIYDKVIEDITEYYSSISLKLLLEPLNYNEFYFNVNDNFNSYYHLLGNICSFSNGNDY